MLCIPGVTKQTIKPLSVYHHDLAYLQRDFNSPDRHSRVYVHADKFEKSEL